MNQKTKTILKSMLVLAMVALSANAFAVYQGPTATPPGANVAPPVNVGGAYQYKTGGLLVGSFKSFGPSLLMGNVGIGTATPDAVLNLSYAGTALSLLHITQTSTGGNFFKMDRTGGTASAWYMYLPTGSTDLRFFSGTDKVTFQAGGNVGIGTTSPGAKLEVIGNVLVRNGTTGSGINIDGTDLASNSYSGVNIYAFDDTAGNGTKYGYTGIGGGGSPVMMFRQNNWGGQYTWGNTMTPGNLANYQEKMRLDRFGTLTVNGRIDATQYCISGANCISAWPSGGTSQWTTSGSDIYYNTGNVGIGTTSPGATLGAIGSVRFNGFGSGDIWLPFTDGNTYLRSPVNLVTNTIKAENGNWLIPNSGNAYFNQGKVGIGTVSPNASLSFGTGLADNKIYLYDGTLDKYGFGVRGNQFMIYSGANGASTGGITFGKFDGTTFTENVRFQNGGNVGIGISPAGVYKLDVNGWIHGSHLVVTDLANAGAVCGDSVGALTACSPSAPTWHAPGGGGGTATIGSPANFVAHTQGDVLYVIASAASSNSNCHLYVAGTEVFWTDVPNASYPHQMYTIPAKTSYFITAGTGSCSVYVLY